MDIKRLIKNASLGDERAVHKLRRLHARKNAALCDPVSVSEFGGLIVHGPLETKEILRLNIPAPGIWQFRFSADFDLSYRAQVRMWMIRKKVYIMSSTTGQMYLRGTWKIEGSTLSVMIPDHLFKKSPPFFRLMLKVEGTAELKLIQATFEAKHTQIIEH